jgi:hypothetical protein
MFDKTFSVIGELIKGLGNGELILYPFIELSREKRRSHTFKIKR